MKAVIYARVSSDDQVQGSSLDTQIQACREYCQRQGYNVLVEFREDYTGASYERPELDKVLDMADLFDVLVVFSVDRFSRELGTHLALLKEFKKHSVRVEYTVGQYDDTPEGRLMMQVQAMIAEYERAQIRLRTNRGRRARLSGGNVLPGRTSAYGYRYVSDEREGTFELVEEEAEVIRQIFQWYTVDKYGSVTIAKMLSDRKVPTKWDIDGIEKPRRKKGVWNHSSVLSILRNTIYYGDYYHDKNTDAPILIKVEPIISKQVFDAAQKQKRKNVDNAKRNTRYEYLMRRRVRCAKCGYKMHAETLKTRKRKVLRYRCTGNKRSHAADGENIVCHGAVMAGELDALVWDFFKYELTDIKRIKKRIEEQRASKIQQYEKDKSEIDQLRRQIEILDEDIATILSRGREVSDEIFNRVIMEKRQERATIEQRLDEIDYQPVSINQVDIAGNLLSDIARADFAERRGIVDKLDAQVLVSHKKDPLIAELSYILDQEKLTVLLTV